MVLFFHSFVLDPLPPIHPFFHASVLQIIFELLPWLKHHPARWNPVGRRQETGVLVPALPLTPHPQRQAMTRSGLHGDPELFCLLMFHNTAQQEIQPLLGGHGWRTFHTHWESWKTYRWLCCTYRHFDLCQYSNFLQRAYFFSGEPRGGVYEWQYAHHIILGPSDGFPNVTFSFCETVNSGGQGMPEKSSPDFSSLPSLCSVFMAPVTGILLQQFVSSALLLRLCIIYDLDSKMLVNCSTRNNGMWQQWIPHSWPKYLSVVYKSFQSTIATLLKLLLRMNSDKTREFG